MVHGVILNPSKTHSRRNPSDSACLSALSSSRGPNWLDLIHVIYKDSFRNSNRKITSLTGGGGGGGGEGEGENEGCNLGPRSTGMLVGPQRCSGEEEVKVNFTLEQATKAQREGRGIALPFL